MARALRKYQAERKIFQVGNQAVASKKIFSFSKELLEVKRVQIRAGRANEAVSQLLKAFT